MGTMTFDYYNPGDYNAAATTVVSGSTTARAALVTDANSPFDPCVEGDVMIETPIEVVSGITGEEGVDGTGGTDEADGEFQLEHYAIVIPSVTVGLSYPRCSLELDIFGNPIDPTDRYLDIMLTDKTNVFGWVKEYILDAPIAKYAAGVDGDWIYMFGGCVDNEWVGVDLFRRYNVKTKQLQSLSSGGIEARADAYGIIMNGRFHVVGGYGVSGDTATFFDEHYIRSSSGSWAGQSVHADRISNKVVGANGTMFMINALSPGEGGGGWNPLHATYQWSGGWSMVYDGSDYTPDTYYNFDTMVFHKGELYYYNEGSLHQVILTAGAQATTVGIPFPASNSKMCSYGDYIIFSHGFLDGGAGAVLETSWFNTVNRTYGTFGVVGEIPQVAFGFDIFVIDGVLYKIGGIPAEGRFGDTVWSLDLKKFFDCLKDPPVMEADTFYEKLAAEETSEKKTIGMCREYPGHPCGNDGSYVRDYNIPGY